MGSGYIKNDSDNEDAPPLISEESSYVDIRKKIIDLAERHAANAFTNGFIVGTVLGAVTLIVVTMIKHP